MSKTNAFFNFPLKKTKNSHKCGDTPHTTQHVAQAAVALWLRNLSLDWIFFFSKIPKIVTNSLCMR